MTQTVEDGMPGKMCGAYSTTRTVGGVQMLMTAGPTYCRDTWLETLTLVLSPEKGAEAATQSKLDLTSNPPKISGYIDNMDPPAKDLEEDKDTLYTTCTTIIVLGFLLWIGLSVLGAYLIKTAMHPAEKKAENTETTEKKKAVNGDEKPFAEMTSDEKQEAVKNAA